MIERKSKVTEGDVEEMIWRKSKVIKDVREEKQSYRG